MVEIRILNARNNSEIERDTDVVAVQQHTVGIGHTELTLIDYVTKFGGKLYERTFTGNIIVETFSEYVEKKEEPPTEENPAPSA